MSKDVSLLHDVPHPGRTTISVQHRCTQMWRHGGTNPLPVPCGGCYSLIVTSVAVPYRPKTPFTTVVEGE